MAGEKRRKLQVLWPLLWRPSAKQRQLRGACIDGNACRMIEALAKGRGLEGFFSPAQIKYVYEDDGGALAIHYLAGGRAAFIERGGWSQLRSQGCEKDAIYRETANTDAARAGLLLGYVMASNSALSSVDLNVVNFHMETPLHIAVQSRSEQFVKAILDLSKRLPLKPVRLAEPDSNGLTPLDLAIRLQQWNVATSLVSGGALDQDSRYIRFLTSLRRHFATVQEELGAPGTTADVSLPSLPIPVPSAVRNRIAAAFQWAVYGSYAERMREMVVSSQGVLHSKDKVLVLEGLEQIKQHRNKLLEHIAKLGEIDMAAASFLLERYHGNDNNLLYDLLVDRDRTVAEVSPASSRPMSARTSFEEPSSARAHLKAVEALAEMFGSCRGASVPEDQEVGIPVAVDEDADKVPSSSGRVQCMICLDDVPLASCQLAEMSCGHMACYSCWEEYLRVLIREGSVASIKCPEPGCKCVLDDDHIRGLVPIDDYERYSNLVAQKFVDGSSKVRWCPQAGCGRALLLESEDCSTRAECAGLGRAVECHCGTSFCWTCLGRSHEPATCAQVREWERLCRHTKQDENVQASEWISAHTRPCPQCRAVIEREDGCNHMTCAICGYQFCWMCMGDWGVHGPSTGGFYSCRRDIEWERINGSQGNDEGCERQPLELTEKQKQRLRQFMRLYYMNDVGGVSSESMKNKIERMRSMLRGVMAPFVHEADKFSFLAKAERQLRHSRSVLAHSFVYAYFLTGTQRSVYFELLQDHLTLATSMLEEALSASWRPPVPPTASTRTPPVRDESLVLFYRAHALLQCQEELEELTMRLREHTTFLLQAVSSGVVLSADASRGVARPPPHTPAAFELAEAVTVALTATSRILLG